MGFIHYFIISLPLYCQFIRKTDNKIYPNENMNKSITEKIEKLTSKSVYVTFVLRKDVILSLFLNYATLLKENTIILDFIRIND